MLLKNGGIEEFIAIRPFKVTITDFGKNRVVMASSVAEPKDANAVKISTNGIQNFIVGNLSSEFVGLILETAYMQERVDLSDLDIKEISRASEISDSYSYYGEMNSIFPYSSNSFSCDDVVIAVIDNHSGNVVKGVMGDGLNELPIY